MKRLITIFIAMASICCTAHAEETTMQLSPYLLNSEHHIDISVGIYLPSRDVLTEETDKFKYPLEITINNYSYGISINKSMIIKSKNDWPLHSVKTDCPKGDVQMVDCWFVKYGDEK